MFFSHNLSKVVTVISLYLVKLIASKSYLYVTLVSDAFQPGDFIQNMFCQHESSVFRLLVLISTYAAFLF